MEFSGNSFRQLGCVLLLVLGVALVVLWRDWLAEPPYHDATDLEVSQVAAKCGATISHFAPTSEDHSRLGLPNVSMTIDAQSREEWESKANCVYSELRALGAFSFISGPNGESLLESGL